MGYSDSVDKNEKEKIWNLFFFEGFSYDDLIAYFKGKYTYSQLKSIILERLRDGNAE
jgi:hypothetical protein